MGLMQRKADREEESAGNHGHNKQRRHSSPMANASQAFHNGRLSSSARRSLRKSLRDMNHRKSNSGVGKLRPGATSDPSDHLAQSAEQAVDDVWPSNRPTFIPTNRLVVQFTAREQRQYIQS